MDEANPNPNLPHFSVSKDDDDENINNGSVDQNNNDDNEGDNNEGDNNEDDNNNCDVDGPTIQAHVDLAKMAYKYCRTQYC
jgi:hypothetical protein